MSIERDEKFESKVISNSILTGEHSRKKTVQIDFELPEGHPPFVPGDTLAVYPHNSTILVNDLLDLIGFDGETAIEIDGCKTSLREALTSVYEISRISRSNLQKILKIIDLQVLKTLLDDSEEFNTLFFGKNIVDLLAEYPIVLDLEQFLSILDPVQPRYYYIATTHSGANSIARIIVGANEYKLGGRDRQGACSTYLIDTVKPGDTVSVALSQHRSIRLPENGETPVIMISAESGIAPFLAFLEERKQKEAAGKNWLLFSSYDEDHDFIYQHDLNELVSEGTISQLDVAFKGELEQSIYVQHKVREHKKQLHKWLDEDNASLYICADNERKVLIVYVAIVRIFAELEDLRPQDAEAKVEALKEAGRIQLSIY